MCNIIVLNIMRPIIVFIQIIFIINMVHYYNIFDIKCYKRASLACAARLADTSCPPEAPFGRLEVTSVNYKGDIISKYVYLRFKIDITRKNTKFVNF